MNEQRKRDFKKLRRLIKWLIFSLVILFCLYRLNSFFFYRGEFNCEHQEIDIRTGRLRFSRYILFFKVPERIEDTKLSKVLPADLIAATKPEWRRVNTFAYGLHYYPIYSFHNAIGQIDTLSQIWELKEIYHFPDELKKKTALHLLALWQYEGDVYLADYYISGLDGLIDGTKRGLILTVLPTLEMPLIETNQSQVIKTVFFPNGQPLDSIQGYINSSGKFIKHGVHKLWQQNGSIRLYENYENGQRHGYKFAWDGEGKLITINSGHIYTHEDLERYPEFKTAQEIFLKESYGTGE
jgi:hypothetical protein